MILASLAVLLPAQIPVVPPSPHDRVVDLAIGADSPVIDGFGPAAVVEYPVEFAGALHVWARSAGEPVLRVEDLALGRVVEGGVQSSAAPYARLTVEPGGFLHVVVGARGEGSGTVELHLAAAPESDLTLEAAARAARTVDRARRVASQGERQVARELVADLVELMRVEGARHSDALNQALTEAGYLAQTVDDPELAHTFFAWVAAARRRSLPPFHDVRMDAIAGLAGAKLRTGDPRGARDLFAAHLEASLARFPESDSSVCFSRLNLGAALFDLGDFRGARPLLEAALVGYERLYPPDHERVLTTRENLAHTIAELGDFAGARALYERILEVRENEPALARANLLHARHGLAVCMRRMGDVEGARALFETVLAEYEQSLPPGDHQLLVARTNLANCLHSMGEPRPARDLLEAVVAAQEERLDGDHPMLLLALANLSTVLADLGELDAARRLDERVLESSLRSLPRDHPDVARARASLALAYHYSGDLERAVELWRSAADALEQSFGRDHPEVVTARVNLAFAFFETGELDAAAELLPTVCASLLERTRGLLVHGPREARQVIASSSRALGCLFHLSDELDLDLEAELFELSETMRVAVGEIGRLLATSQSDPELGPVLDRVDALRRALSDAVAGIEVDDVAGSDLAAHVTRLSLERDSLEREAARGLARRGIEIRSVDVASLSGALQPGEVAVGYRRMARWESDPASGKLLIGADRLLAHVLRADGTLARVDLGAAGEIAALMAEWRACLGAPLERGVGSRKPGDADRIGADLRRRTLDPILAAAGAEVRRLFVCPDDLLFLLPFEALPAPEGSPPDRPRVGDHWRIVNQVSFAGRLAPRSAEAEVTLPPSLLAVGGIDYDAGVAEESDHGTHGAPRQRFERLPQTGFEVEAIARLFERAFDARPRLLVGTEATKDALAGAAGDARYVHVSTHGWFAPETVRVEGAPAPPGSPALRLEQSVVGLAPMTLCGLALAGANGGRDSLGRVPGILTAEELCALDLADCDLAVLSACETNVGVRRAGLGVQSLQTALYAAGVRASITSLWRVDDAATRRLMELFYTHLWTRGLSIADALWHAKSALRGEGHAASDWAAWVLTGDPD